MSYYIIESGNWKIRIGVDDTLFNTPREIAFEAATRAIESIIGFRDFEDEEDILELYNSEGNNIFELDENEVSIDEYEPAFGICILVYKDSKKKTIPTYHHLASKVFANAAMPDMVKGAVEAEKEHPDVMAAFNKLDKNS